MSSSGTKKLARVSAPREVARPDPELMLAIARGELAALGTVYDRYQSDLLRFFHRMGLGESDADDLLHETFIRLIRAARLYDGRPSARGFLIGIAAKQIRSRRRSLGRLGEILRAFAAELSPRLVAPQVDGGGQEERARIEHALGRLTAEKRMAFVMVEGEGMSAEEVASILGIPIATVWTRLHHARKELRKSLARGGQR